jgi:hypothetical protein
MYTYVVKVTRIWAGLQEFDSQYDRIFLFATTFRPALGPTKPPIQWVRNVLSSGVKRPGREANKSLPPIVGDKNARRSPTCPRGLVPC